MKKSIELPQTTIKALENNATMILIPIVNKTIIDTIESNIDNEKVLDALVKIHSPLQIGDKDVWIKEEFGISLNGTVAYMSDYTSTDKRVTSNLIDIKDVGEMTQEHSRYTLIEILDMKIVRVQEILEFRKAMILGRNPEPKTFGHKKETEFEDHYNQQLKEQNINRTYNDKDYVFLMEIKI